LPSGGELRTYMQARVPYIDRIWRAESSIELDPVLPTREAFERLAPLFDTQGTEVAIDGNTLSYAKTNPAAQDKLATFTSGTLLVVEDEAKNATSLSYEVGSTALFLCFLAPLAFLAFGQFAELINEIEKPALIAEKAAEEKEKAEKAEEAEEKLELHWIDQMLGAPERKRRGEDDEENAREDGRSEGREEGRGDEVEGRHSSRTAYVFAGIFFAIYLVGRALEPYLLKRTFRAALAGPSDTDISQPNQETEAGSHPAPNVRGT